MELQETVARIRKLQLQEKLIAAEIKQLKSELPYEELGTYEIGDYKVTLSPNRRLDKGTAEQAVKDKIITRKQFESIMVQVPDATLAKQHLTGLQLEKCMKEYPNPRITIGEK